MTGLPLAVRELLACPQCHGALVDGPQGASLECPGCALRFPIREGIPVMLLTQAEPLDR